MDTESVLDRLQNEAALGRALLDVVKASGLLRPRRRRRRAAAEAPKVARKPKRRRTTDVETEDGAED